jgi:hypothetical protein
MPLAAAQVIDALAARLGTVSATGGRVQTSRTWPLATADLPCWRVLADGEDCELVALDGSLHRHQLSVSCRAFTSATADLDDALHALASAGLQALFLAPAPHALELLSINRGMATEGEAKLGTVTLLVRAEFYANPAAPETIIS